MNNEFLPIGSVVILNGGTKKIMITGYYSKAKDSDKVYDYSGCIFPEGIMENVYCLFDENQIEKIFYEGYKGEEYKDYSNKVRSILANRSSNAYKNVVSAKKGESNKSDSGRRRIPKPPTKPMSSSEMKSKYGVVKTSGENDYFE